MDVFVLINILLFAIIPRSLEKFLNRFDDFLLLLTSALKSIVPGLVFSPSLNVGICIRIFRGDNFGIRIAYFPGIETITVGVASIHKLRPNPQLSRILRLT